MGNKSKLVQLFNKKEIAFCRNVDLSIRPSSREGALKAFLYKRGLKAGMRIDFSKVQGMKGALGRKERAFMVKFLGLDVKPEAYAVKYDEDGKANGFNTKKIVKATIVKA